MGTLEVFSHSYCAGRNSCVLVDAWLELFLSFCTFLVVCGLLVASRGCWLCGRRRIHRVITRTTRRVAWRVRRRLRKCGLPIAGRTSPLPLAVIKKDATAAHIHGHKNSQQQGEAFILQTQRMHRMDFAAQSSPLSEEQSQPQFPPMVFPDDHDDELSPAPPEDEKRAFVRASTVALTKRDQSKPIFITRQRSKSAMDPPKSNISAKVRAVSISVARSPRHILGVRISGSRTDSADSSMSSERLRTNSSKKRFQIFKKRMPSRAHSQALFNGPSYATKNGMAGLSPEDRAENERRASMHLRDKRRVSVGASSHVQFEVGGDQASVYEVKLREVNLVKRLASGPLSEVYAAIWRDTKVGVKLLMPREGVVDNLEEAVKNFRREIWVMHALKHPNIVKLLGASLTHSCYVLVMEYMPNGSLYDYLRDAANFFPHQLVVTSAFDIASGMAHIHACDVLQRDLKSKNCLLSENLVVKVSDFGLARFRSLQYGSYTWVGTPFWAAPEVIRHEPYDEKADVYSYGIVLWELVERKDPYDNLNAFQVPLQVANEGLRPADFTRPAPLGLEQLMRQCWDADPEQRPSFADISQTLSTWLRTKSCEGDDSRVKSIAETDASVDLSAHIQRGQITATQAELHRFAESHDANAKVIPITLSSLRKGLSTSRLQRTRSTKNVMTASEIEELRINSTLGIPGLEEFGGSNGRFGSSGSIPNRRRLPGINPAQLEVKPGKPNEQ
ncbi:TKL/DRK protein kinase [Phytophthora nicotianae CJ01A1]|uniref:TKL/DRK protein kinase n=5 Tax=Phytophthora nicotianae TaxID=4792 RepID=W2R9H5_PHYN3|nr:TKL/DRK protein kinase [Phytophthora nicotianae INRA-310]ETM44615.1 TKL/DRK protein kinase [Phytophthora nicotianae]ETN21876.1 TKL/DRK protein kinase [Phytophthora nicotianae INRA-310]ETP14588.1 TKL/DRK protein kinase [Phytophthora nicotianae CJ01A1]ETP42669.1 TKL/DRK protein kinase [Phytophthora nicotianae P10297]